MRGREKGHRDSSDNGLRIAFDGIGSYDRMAQSFPNLAIRLTWQDFDCKTYRIVRRSHRTLIDTKSRPYIMYSNFNTAESRTLSIDMPIANAIFTTFH